MAKAEVIQPFLEKTMKELLGLEDLVVWDDGTVPVRSGSAGVYVKLVERGDRTYVNIHSPLLRNLQSSPKLLEKLNEINAGTSQTRVYWVPDQVIVSIDLLAEALDRQELSSALDIVSGFADHWDTELRSLFGGEIVFEDAAPKPPEGVPTLPAPPEAGAPPGTETTKVEAKADDDRAAGYL